MWPSHPIKYWDFGPVTWSMSVQEKILPNNGNVYENFNIDSVSEDPILRKETGIYMVIVF